MCYFGTFHNADVCEARGQCPHEPTSASRWSRLCGSSALSPRPNGDASPTNIQPRGKRISNFFNSDRATKWATRQKLTTNYNTTCHIHTLHVEKCILAKTEKLPAGNCSFTTITGKIPGLARLQKRLHQGRGTPTLPCYSGEVSAPLPAA